jgi:hypothetical protein
MIDRKERGDWKIEVTNRAGRVIDEIPAPNCLWEEAYEKAQEESKRYPTGTILGVVPWDGKQITIGKKGR